MGEAQANHRHRHSDRIATLIGSSIFSHRHRYSDRTQLFSHCHSDRIIAGEGASSMGEATPIIAIVIAAPIDRIIGKLNEGPWFIGQQFLSVHQWSLGFCPFEAKTTTTTIWARLPELPIELYDRCILQRIGNQLGNLLKVDARTIDNVRGRFAQLCVQIDLDSPLTSKQTPAGPHPSASHDQAGGRGPRAQPASFSRKAQTSSPSNVDASSYAENDKPGVTPQKTSECLSCHTSHAKKQKEALPVLHQPHLLKKPFPNNLNSTTSLGTSTSKDPALSPFGAMPADPMATNLQSLTPHACTSPREASPPCMFLENNPSNIEIVSSSTLSNPPSSPTRNTPPNQLVLTPLIDPSQPLPQNLFKSHPKPLGSPSSRAPPTDRKPSFTMDPNLPKSILDTH
nr:hypothetical protein CFP56_10899 [Quercus suber]